MTLHTEKIPRGESPRPDRPPREQKLSVGAVLWDRYEVTAELGAGQLGELWRGFDRETGKDICLRRLPPDLRRSKPVMAVIHAGIRRIADQVHPNLAAIRRVVYVGDEIYLVGDFPSGVDIGTWAQAGADGRRTLAEVLPVLRQVAEALDYAHEKRIIHRNLKPSNIFIGPNDGVQVTDFGLAPHHHLTLLHGEALRAGSSGPYLAPELRENEEPDSASDQYALGVLALELLSGSPPDLAGNGILPASLPGSARAALRRALAPKPRRRFVTCVDFVRALGGERVGGSRRLNAAERRRLLIVIGTVLGVTGLGTGVWLGGQALADWLDALNAPVVRTGYPRHVPVPKQEPVEEAAGFEMPEPLIAATPLPEPDEPWVTQTGRMEFVWIPPMQMWVGRYEVVNAQYALMKPGHDSGAFRNLSLKGPRQPVVRVNFDDATAYAAWLTKQERAAGKLPADLAYRLPLREEAILYTRAGMARNFPWGELWPPTRGNYADAALGTAFADMNSIGDYQDGYAVTAPVEHSGENAWGLFGAGGNVWETTAKAPDGEEFAGWQGGGWDDYQPARMGADICYGFLGNARGAVNGFRLVLAPVVPQPPPAKAAPQQ